MKLKKTIAISFFCLMGTGLQHASAVENTIGMPVAASTIVAYTGSSITSHTLEAKSDLSANSDNIIAIGSVQFTGATEYVAVRVVGSDVYARNGIQNVAIKSDDQDGAVMSAHLANLASEGFVSSYTEGDSIWSKFKNNGTNMIKYSVKGELLAGNNNRKTFRGNYPLNVEAVLLSR